MSANIINIEAGQKYGRWTVASTGLRNGGKRASWCVCGAAMKAWSTTPACTWAKPELRLPACRGAAVENRTQETGQASLWQYPACRTNRHPPQRQRRNRQRRATATRAVVDGDGLTKPNEEQHENPDLPHQKLSIRLKMRSATAEIDAAERRIANDKLLMERLYRYRSELQADLFWAEKQNMQVRGANA